MSTILFSSATPTCHPYWWCWWCAGAGITLERHHAAAPKSLPLLLLLLLSLSPYTHVSPFESYCASLSARLRRRRNHISSHRQNLHALCPLGLSERPRRYAFYFRQLPLREGVRLNPRFPLQYHSSLLLFCCQHLPCQNLLRVRLSSSSEAVHFAIDDQLHQPIILRGTHILLTVLFLAVPAELSSSVCPSLVVYLRPRSRFLCPLWSYPRLSPPQPWVHAPDIRSVGPLTYPNRLHTLPAHYLKALKNIKHVFVIALAIIEFSDSS